MKTFFKLFCGVTLLSAAPWVMPFSMAKVVSAESLTQPHPAAIALVVVTIAPQSQISDAASDDYDPPNTGGPARSGGSGTR